MVSGLYANHALNTISQSHDYLLLANFFLAKKTIACSRWSRVRARVDAGPPMGERGRMLAEEARSPVPGPRRRAAKEGGCREFTFSLYYSNHFSALRYSNG